MFGVNHFNNAQGMLKGISTAGKGPNVSAFKPVGEKNASLRAVWKGVGGGVNGVNIPDGARAGDIILFDGNIFRITCDENGRLVPKQTCVLLESDFESDRGDFH